MEVNINNSSCGIYLFVFSLLLSACETQLPSVRSEDCATSTYVVNSTADDLPSESFCALGAECSLRVAINNANHCRSRGPQTIQLGEDLSYVLGAVDTDPGYLGGEWARMNAAYGDVTLPYIMGEVTIRGLRSTIVKRHVEASLFHVAPGGSLRLSGLTLSGETGRTGKGGAIYNQGQLNMNVEASGFSAAQGGVLYNSGTALLAGDYTDNRADEGGIIYNSGSLTYEGGELSRSSALLGGAIYSSGNAQIKDAVFTENSASGLEPFPGTSIFSNNNNLSVFESVFRDHQNDAIVVGRDAANISIKSSSFVENGNDAEIVNGLVANVGGILRVSSSTISNNSGRGAIMNCVGTPDSVMYLEDSTISHNTVLEDFGAAFIVSGVPPNSCLGKVSNSVIASTTGAPNCAAVSDSLSEASTSASDDDSCGFRITVDDVRLGPLTRTAPTLLTSGRKPLGDSPLINAGANCAVRDQARQRRPLRPSSGESACDIGALEVR